METTNRKETVYGEGKKGILCDVSTNNLTDNQFNITAVRYLYPPKTFKFFGQPLERWIVW